ncbi:hypothetical protein NEDG_01486 [Nematocida displodere]|uniref:Uncharacterized protein n=1 Tax=Nematocida displodere TaxID=1805483 RepID=A0A177EG15_9MICR|nr:hypothetical protein NEDG_01486 [Nematocida displodere]
MKAREKEWTSEEESRDVDEDIKKMMAQQSQPKEADTSKETAAPTEIEVSKTIELMKQLATQYDELEGYLRRAESSQDVQDGFPVDLVTSLVKSTKISPTLIKMVSTLSEESKELRKEMAVLKSREEKVVTQVNNLNTTERAKKLELKYLEQSVSETSRELKAARDETYAQRKKILELEAALDAQKKIGKELLQTKTATQQEIDIHDNEKSLLKRVIDDKDSVIERLKCKYEDLEYEVKRTRRENDIFKIQHIRLQKRADLKDKALDACNQEMDKMIRQLDRLTKMDTQKKEKLEYLKIIKKRLEHENKDLYAVPRQRPSSAQQTDPNHRPEDLSKEPKPPRRAGHPPHTARPSTAKPASRPDHLDLEDLTSSEVSESELPRPVTSFSRAVDTASLPSESEASEETRTASSFKEMQQKTDEMTKKFKELERLLQEIKKGNETELERVESKIPYRPERK